MRKTSKLFFFYTGALLVLAIALMLYHNPGSISRAAVNIWLRQSSILGILSIGLMFINLCGDFDLSTGSIMSLSAACCVSLLRLEGLPLPLLLLAVLALAALCGLSNGLLAAWFRMPHFLVSLGTMMGYVGVMSLLADGQPVAARAPDFFALFQSTLLGVPLPAVIWLTLLTGAQFLLQSTYVGQYFYAIGDNEGALRAIGVNTRRYKLVACLLCGLFAGVAGIFMMARTSAAVATYNIETVFQAITVLAISGIYQPGARCNLWAVLLGTITVTCTLVCMTVYAIHPTLQNVILALIFFGALTCSRRKA